MWRSDYYVQEERRAAGPSATTLLLIANIAVFLFELTLSPYSLEKLIYSYGMVPADVAWYTLVTSMFLHGGWFHIFGNMWILWMLGMAVESRMGRWRFLAFYFLSGLVAGGAHLLANVGSEVPTIGASGAIAGVMGAALVLFPRERMLMMLPPPLFFFVEVPVYVYLGFWFVTQLLSGTASLVHPEATGGIAWWAHIGGFIAGILLQFAFVTRRPVRKSFPY
jgi:membrane associated rhomboid family serine protease